MNESISKLKKECVNQNKLLIKKKLSFIAGWSSLVARQAHNLKVVGSNPTPATKNYDKRY